MTNQTNLNNAIARLNDAVKASTCASDVAAYWTGLLGKRYTLHANGTVQSTMTNPLAYFCVPLAGDGTKGRTHNFVMAQFDYALTHGLTKNAHVALRGIDETAIKAGMSFARPRQDSALGSVEGRLAASMVSAQSNAKARQAGAKEVLNLEAAKQGNNRVAFENTSLSIAAILEKYSKPAASKPAASKPAAKKA